MSFHTSCFIIVTTSIMSCHQSCDDVDYELSLALHHHLVSFIALYHPLWTATYDAISSIMSCHILRDNRSWDVISHAVSSNMSHHLSFVSDDYELSSIVRYYELSCIVRHHPSWIVIYQALPSIMSWESFELSSLIRKRRLWAVIYRALLWAVIDKELESIVRYHLLWIGIYSCLWLITSCHMSCVIIDYELSSMLRYHWRRAGIYGAF